MERRLDQGLKGEKLTIINTGDAGPELLLQQVGLGVSGCLTGVRAGPLGGEQIALSVGGVLENVALARLLAGLDVGNLLADGDQGVAEAVQLGLVL